MKFLNSLCPPELFQLFAFFWLGPYGHPPKAVREAMAALVDCQQYFRLRCNMAVMQRNIGR
ncbi:hypothetical protein RHIZ404_190079 [Rhizobium sp. EC-SD404]|nr:hypothetical protein RHIZ404_190079 [Rhizobium sp. EC-SD404]